MPRTAANATATPVPATLAARGDLLLPAGWRRWLPAHKVLTVAVLVAVWGASPGIGKSTLCTGLSRWLADAGLGVDHFQEEEVLTRPQFATVAEEFQADGTIQLASLLTATASFVESVLAGGVDVVVADALVPYIPTLLAMGHSDQVISAFMAELTEILAPLLPVVVFLDGDAATALSRAAAREGPDWLDWYIGKLARYQVHPPVHDAASAADYLSRERAVTLSEIRCHGWDLITIEGATSRSPEDVLQAARQQLSPRVASPAQTARALRGRAGRSQGMLPSASSGSVLAALGAGHEHGLISS
jgi:thymidylate kinase